jgi:hypothetical protein
LTVVALVLALAFVVLVLGVLVAGLLRSHADILRALHDLGAGVGDPMGEAPHRHGQQAGETPVALTLGPPLPSERDATSAAALTGVTPGGDAIAVDVLGERLTLLAFLSSGCATCAGFWESFSHPGSLDLPEGVRLVAVTKGPEFEIPAEVGARAHRSLTVVMSTEAWSDYEVPGSPFFVLVDGRTGRRVGEGVANQFSQVAELVRRAQGDVRPFDVGSRSRAFAEGLDGPARERANDDALLAAGIQPGHPSLYPASLPDVFAADAPPGGEGAVRRVP